VLQDFLANAIAHQADEHYIDVAVKEALQVLLEVPQGAMRRPRLQVHGDVDIAVGSEIIADRGAEYAQSPHVVAPGERAKLFGARDGQGRVQVSEWRATLTAGARWRVGYRQVPVEDRAVGQSCSLVREVHAVRAELVMLALDKFDLQAIGHDLERSSGAEALVDVGVASGHDDQAGVPNPYQFDPGVGSPDDLSQGLKRARPEGDFDGRPRRWRGCRAVSAIVRPLRKPIGKQDVHALLGGAEAHAAGPRQICQAEFARLLQREQHVEGCLGGDQSHGKVHSTLAA
jgi:hypothetical protein